MKKNIFYYVIVLVNVSIFMMSCEKDFLQKPMGSDLNIDSIFSTRENALTAIARAYAIGAAPGIQVQNENLTEGWVCHDGSLAHASQEINMLKSSWGDCYKFQRTGMAPVGINLSGVEYPFSVDAYHANWKSLRQSYLVIENIDKVRDMTDAEKTQVKAEMKALIAYRYSSMLIRYGGVPIVTKSLMSDEDVMIPRSSLKEVLDHAMELLDEAYPDLPDSYPPNDNGRVTKGIVLCIKAEALLFAARPLFNSATPYLDFGENNKLICLGDYQQQRLLDAIAASEAVLDWASKNNYYIIKDKGTPLDNYGTAVATPGNREVLWAYKRINSANSPVYDVRRPEGGANGMSFYQLKQYYKADGTNQVWPENEVDAAGNPKQYPYSDYAAKIQEMEPRYKASAMGAGIDAWNNPNDRIWSWNQTFNSYTWAGIYQTEASGRLVKFWYKAGTRTWFEYPIFRLAEFYLNLAELYNEVGNPQKALANLNVIRDRAGLPQITVTDKDQLRKIIQREWAVEFYFEGHAIFDVKHWKREDIGNGVIGGSRKSLYWYYIPGRAYAQSAADYVSYSVQELFTCFWAPNQFLCPFPQREVNKGYLVQNPGY